MCAGASIDNIRHRIEHAGMTSVIDVFGGANAGLVAEIAIPGADTPVELPVWVGADLTDDRRDFNANLLAHPFRAWGATELWTWHIRQSA